MSDTPRPTASCGCGYDLVWVNGQWEHDAAPSLWGGDHDPDAPEPVDLDRVFWDEQDLGPSKPVMKVPPFQMDAAGEYTGDAYPRPEEYRIHMVEETGTDNMLLSVEDHAGNEVIETLTITPELADGIIGMAQIDHGLGGYEDDWKIPAGMDRTITWTLGDNATYLALSKGHIDEIASWLRFATGEEEWDGGDEWEY